MIFRSPLPDVFIPPVSLPALMLSNARQRGNRPALINAVTGANVTYRELADLVERVAGALIERGLHKGDVCAIYSPNLPEYAIAFLAITSFGGVVTTANPLNTANELAAQLADSRARALFTVPALAQTALEAARCAEVRDVFTFGPAEATTDFAKLTSVSGRPVDVDIDSGKDLAALPYSSGTTGLPKGVMLTHRNIVANILQLDAADHLHEDQDTLIAFLPFFHIYGMAVILGGGLYRGATLVVVAKFDLLQYLELVERYRPTVLHIVPPIALALAQHAAVEGRDFSSVRMLFSGAAPLSGDLMRRCSERLGCIFRQGYGLTEASPATHFTLPGLPAAAMGSIGCPLPNTECKIVDVMSGTPVGFDQEGELWLRGPQVMKGYLRQPEATRRTVDSDGWLHTGDIVRADDHRNFYVVDRLKELIKYKACQIAPAELEAVLLTHPAVSDAAVIGVPDVEAGEVPKAFVTLKVSASEAELMAFVAARVAPYKKVRQLEIVQSIPKSASGKILRRLLRDMERNKTGQEAPQRSAVS